MYKDSTFAQCLSRHEDFLALKLGLGPGQICVDVGCGVGGPLREIAKFTGATVVGLNNNDYQVKRCQYLAQKTGLADLCRAVKGNFEDMPFEKETFDAAYAIEATCHARDLKNPYGEVFRVLKPGGKFACYEWLVTPEYDETNPTHKEIIWNLEQGNSIPKLQSYEACIQALKDVGFEVIEHYDLADPKSLRVRSSQDPWHTPLKGSYGLSIDEISRWKMTPIGRFITDTFVWILETIGIAPAGTCKISKSLNLGAEGLVKAGDLNLFTPMYFFLAQKPAKDAAPAAE
ncbi:Delta(24)-sterol C-methyltransferase [Kappamyces sp. JEL0829]|nr:Delta(24)-sterol C-methyltransferase [Kappamyces sp. JEL0829]